VFGRREDQLGTDDYYAADIVWTTALHGEGARVAQISIRRELDKH
jgi:hypothetical protein